MRENTSVHRLLRRVLSLCLAVGLAVPLCVPALSAQKNYSASDYVQRLKDSVRGSATVDLDAGKDPNEVVRAMVVTDVPAAVEQAGTVTYTAAVQSAEARTLRSQESVIRQVRRITGSSVINQSGYLVSAFSMDMTRAQMKQVAALDGVVSVSEVTTYKARMTSAKEMTSAMELWKAENGGSTGEGIVVAVIDSGINYTHPDMQMRQDARLKYTKADMEAKIAAENLRLLQRRGLSAKGSGLCRGERCGGVRGCRQRRHLRLRHGRQHQRLGRDRYRRGVQPRHLSRRPQRSLRGQQHAAGQIRDHHQRRGHRIQRRGHGLLPGQPHRLDLPG